MVNRLIRYRQTTLAQKIVDDAREEGVNTILIDGDVIRDVFGNDLGYSEKDRLQNAQRVCRLGKFLDQQGFHVVQ